MYCSLMLTEEMVSVFFLEVKGRGVDWKCLFAVAQHKAHNCCLITVFEKILWSFTQQRQQLRKCSEIDIIQGNVIEVTDLL